ncbi:calcium-binding protein [Sphingomonas citri]
MRFNEPNQAYQNAATIPDGVELAASGITFTNSESGRVRGGVAFTAAGATLVNQNGGIIRLTTSDTANTLVIQGSDGVDTIRNDGLITGAVALGGGTDRFVAGDASDVRGTVDMGAGDDVFRLESFNLRGRALGGDGWDRLEVAANGGAFSFSASGFEDVFFAQNATLYDLSGARSVSAVAGASFRLFNSLSPQAVVSVNGGEFQLDVGSRVSRIVGGDGQDGFRLSTNAAFDNADLGGGNDYFATAAVTLSQANPMTADVAVSGGAGRDQIFLGTADATPTFVEHYTLDLTRWTAFEELVFGSAPAINGALPGSDIVLTAAGSVFDALDVGENNRLEIASTVGGATARANVVVGARSTLVLAGDATQVASVYAITARTAGGVTADDTASITIVNNGSIQSTVRLGIGDDVYDGRLGYLNGSFLGAGVLGGLGNDTIWTGAYADVLDGGAGADDLRGFAGNDRLSGGSGNDRLDGGSGNDDIDGGSGDDVMIGGSGNNRYSGGDGIDTLVLSSTLGDARVLVYGNNGTTIFVDDEGAHAVSGVEKVQFVNGTVSISAATAAAQPFNALRYLAGYNDLYRAFGTNTAAAAQHFALLGLSEGRDANKFDALGYIASYGDLRSGYGLNDYEASRHYLLYGADEGRTITFDALRYVASYGDLITGFGLDLEQAKRHYIQFGASEGRVASFDWRHYLATYSDLLAQTPQLSQEAVIRQYITQGYAEGRREGFDPLAYGAANTDLAAAFGANPEALLQHRLSFGAVEGTRPLGGFDQVAYLLSNADLQAGGFGPALALAHWFAYGAREGRGGDAAFGREQPTHALTGARTVGMFERDGDHDWFTLSAAAGRTIDLDLSGVTAGSTIQLHRSNGVLLASALAATGQTVVSLDYLADSSDGDYYVVIADPLGDPAASTYVLDLHLA